MKRIVKCLLEEGIDESMIHRVLDLIEEETKNNSVKKAQILGYNNGVGKVIFERPITKEYTLDKFQKDRINTINNNKDFQNFETRLRKD